MKETTTLTPMDEPQDHLYLAAWIVMFSIFLYAAWTEKWWPMYTCAVVVVACLKWWGDERGRRRRIQAPAPEHERTRRRAHEDELSGDHPGQ